MNSRVTKPLPSLEELNERLTLDLETGHLFWKPITPVSGRFTQTHCRKVNVMRAGKRADHPCSKGVYLVVKFRLASGTKLVTYSAHRIVFKMVNGHDPLPTVDHIDRNGLNNKPTNLREATHLENSLNRGPSLFRKEGRGVYRAKNGKYRSQISMFGRIVHLGTFATEAEAAAAFATRRAAIAEAAHSQA